MNHVEEYAGLVDTVIALLALKHNAGARIILATNLAVSTNIAPVSDVLFNEGDDRAQYFERSCGDALAMLDSQIEDTALAEMRLCKAIMNEVQIS